MPVEQFMRDLPFTAALEQSKNIGCAGVGSGQLARPMFYLQMNDGDTLNDFNACEARINIWRRTVFVDPPEDVFNGACVLHSLAVARNGCGRMKRRSHDLPVTCTRTRDVGMHRASDRIMLDEVRIGSRIRSGEVVGLVGRKGAGAPGS